ncbi:MAG: helix-turn-helix transcriptional regulator [Anaerolineae bacterium]
MCGGHHGEQPEGDACCPTRGRVQRFLQPWLLLLLAQRRAHGYELMERLGQDDDSPAADPGLLYRTLRQMEQEGLVRSTWDTAKPGPARRVYEITEEGLEHLHVWAINIRRTRARLDHFLAGYEALVSLSGEGQ